MADKYDTTIKLGLDADLSGGIQTEKQLGQVRKEAKRLENDAKAGGASIENAFGKATKAVGLFRRALTGFGVVGAIMGLIAAIGKVTESFGAARKEAEALAKAREAAEHKDAVEALAKSYEQLAEATQRAAEATKHANEMQDIALKNARALEDAQLDLAEQKELGAVDASDPAAAEKRAAISARYAAQRGSLTESRSREDLNTERNRLMAEASAKRASAGQIAAATGDIDQLIASTEARRRAAYNRSRELNAEDNTSFWGSVGGGLKDVVTLNWGNVGNMRTGEGDRVRAAAKEEEAQLAEELKRLREQRAAKLKEAEQLRAEASRIDERAGLIGGALDVVDVKEAATNISASRGVAAADTTLAAKNRAIAKKQAEAAADAATIAQGPGRISALQQQIAAIEAQKLAAQQADAKEQMDVVLSQSALDSFNSAGHRRNGTGVQAARGALEADVERETREATQSRMQLQTTLATLSATLKGLNADLKKVQRDVDTAVKRQAATNDEAPEG